MALASPDDELLSILLVNLRNAAATFGEGSPPHETVRTTVEDHLQAMRAKGCSTNITAARGNQQQQSSTSGEGQTSIVFGSLAFRPKPS